MFCNIIEHMAAVFPLLFSVVLLVSIFYHIFRWPLLRLQYLPLFLCIVFYLLLEILWLISETPRDSGLFTLWGWWEFSLFISLLFFITLPKKLGFK